MLPLFQIHPRPHPARPRQRHFARIRVADHRLIAIGRFLASPAGVAEPALAFATRCVGRELRRIRSALCRKLPGLGARLERRAVVQYDERAEDAAFGVPHDEKDQRRARERDADDEKDHGPRCGGRLCFDEVSDCVSEHSLLGGCAGQPALRDVPICWAYGAVGA